MWLDSVDSTNEEAKRRAAAGERGPLWIGAYAQTAGRGRRGRAWDSQPGNLFCTLLLRPVCPPARLSEFAFLIGLAVADVVAHWTDPALVRLKWPNDVLLGGAKVAGCLLESGQDALGRWLALGVGVNIASAPSDTPYPATYLRAHLPPDWKAPPPNPDAAADMLYYFFRRWEKVWNKNGFAPLRTAFLARAAGLGEPIVARLADGSDLSGAFEDLDETGALILRAPSGARRAVSAADIFFPSPLVGEGKG